MSTYRKMRYMSSLTTIGATNLIQIVVASHSRRLVHGGVYLVDDRLLRSLVEEGLGFYRGLEDYP